MNKILFINPSLRPDAKRKYPPVGLAFVMSAAKKAKYEFDLYDMDANNYSIENFKKFIERNEYDIFAVGCIVTGFRLIKEISETIKLIYPNSIIISGNSIATSVPNLLLKKTGVDIAVIGEADSTIVDLLNCLENNDNLSAIEGIAYIDNGNVIRTRKRKIIKRLDDIGFPDWDIFEIEKYNINMQKLTVHKQDNQVVFPLNAARGCPYSCTFCYHVFKGQPYRKYSEEYIVREIKRLYYKYNANFIQFWDELTFPNVKSVEYMVDALENLSFRVNWEGISRADLFDISDINLIKRLRHTGCKSMCFSIENASVEILKAMNKKISLNRVVDNSIALQEGGVTPLTSIIFGYPEETPKTIKATIDLCRQCNIYPSVGYLQPLPGTSIYNWAINNKYINDEYEYLMTSGDRQDFHLNLTKMSDEEFIGCVTEELYTLSVEMGLSFKNPLKTGVYQTSQNG